MRRCGARARCVSRRRAVWLGELDTKAAGQRVGPSRDRRVLRTASVAGTDLPSEAAKLCDSARRDQAAWRAVREHLLVKASRCSRCGVLANARVGLASA
jgi:hypothetical protein